MSTKGRKTKYINTQSVDDDIFLLDELLKDEMYERSEKSLYDYIINFWGTFEPSAFINNWHIETLASHAQAALNRQIRRLIINIPPRSSKSIVNSICLPTWGFINSPHEKFWLISHSARLFVQNIIYARKIMEHPLYKERWCTPALEDHFRFTLSTDQNTKTRIDNSAGGYLLGGSPTSGALGMGYSVAVLDDILDSEAASSITEIQSINTWYTQTFLNRSNNVSDDVVIIVMQRLHQSDLTNYVTTMYGDQNWTILNLPAKYEPERTFISPIGYNDKRTKRNELLDPIRLPDSFLATQAKNPLIYNTRYQQNPDAEKEGNIVKAEWVQEAPKKPINYTAMITVWDLSFTDSPESSYTVGLVMVKFEDEYHIVDMLRKQIAIPEQVDAIRHLRKKYPKSVVGIEKKANGHAAISLLQREINDIYTFEPRLFGGSKEQRFNAILPYLRDKKFFIYSPFITDDRLESTYSVDAIKQEIKSFPLGKTNDIVDCLSYGLQWLAEYGAVSQGMITKGEKIMMSEEDYTSIYRSKVYNIYNPANFFDEDFIPSRDDIMAINW